MLDNIYWNTTFCVCGELLDPVLIESKLNIKPTAFVRAGEFKPQNSLSKNDRILDSRHYLDVWKCRLSGKQYERTLEEQLIFWCDKLETSQKGLNFLSNEGIWLVIDSQGYLKDDSITNWVQFSISSKLWKRLSKLNVDVDFGITK